MKTFQSKKAIWWSIGLFVLLIGVFVIAVAIPSRPLDQSTGPDMDDPVLENSPDQSDSDARPLAGAVNENEEAE